MRKFDSGSAIAIAFVGILAIATYSYQGQVMDFTRLILEKNYLKIFLNMAIIIIVFTHSIKVKSHNTESLLVKSGFLPIDIFLTVSTYIAISTTACSLLEGAFLQKFFQKTYFLQFDQLDIYVLLGVSALLLWYVALHMYQLGIELLFPSMVKPEPSTQEMHNKSNQSDTQKQRTSV